MKWRALVLWLIPLVLCGGCGALLSAHMGYVKRQVNSDVVQAYESASNGRYDLIRAKWLQGPTSIRALKRLDLLYGSPRAWAIRHTYVDVAGSSFGGEVVVRRERLETFETFDFGGIRGIDRDLSRVPRGGSLSHDLVSADEALKVAKPLLHQLDWDMAIKDVTATEIGDEWRVECKGVVAGAPQTRYLILSKEGEAVEHVRSRLADNPRNLNSQ